jgi:hypothetical protein
VGSRARQGRGLPGRRGARGREGARARGGARRGGAGHDRGRLAREGLVGEGARDVGAGACRGEGEGRRVVGLRGRCGVRPRSGAGARRGGRGGAGRGQGGHVGEKKGRGMREGEGKGRGKN